MSTASGKLFRLRNPWYDHWRNAWRRCNEENHKSFKSHGALGIKCIIQMHEVQFLYFRDKAYLMVKPSLERIRPAGNYSLPNCKFMEFIDNCQRPHRERREAMQWMD